MTNLDRIFQRFFCVLGFLALTHFNAGLYGWRGVTWDDQLASWFASGVFMACGAFVGMFWTGTVTEIAPSDVRR